MCIRDSPRELPNGLDHPYFVPTADRDVDRQRIHHVAGHTEIANGYEYPSEFLSLIHISEPTRLALI
eukprot:14314209-Alexandrium_andersonii.AAC.1